MKFSLSRSKSKPDTDVQEVSNSIDEVYEDPVVKKEEEDIIDLENGSNFEVSRKANVEEQLKELDCKGNEFKQQHGFFNNVKNLEFETNFKNKKTMVLMLGTFASFAGILSGIDQSIISGASIGMNKMLHLSSHEASLVSSLMPLGAVAGSILLTPFSEILGRKKSLVISCGFYTMGAIICAAALNVETMYAGRFFIGVGVGLEGGGVGVYIAECVPSNVRGSLVSLYQFNIALGELFGYIIGVIFFDVYGGWRFMVGSSLIFSTILFIGLLFLPESPRWLMHKGRIGESWNVWKRLRDTSLETEQLEFLELIQAANQDKDLHANESKFQAYFDLIRVPRNRRALIFASIMIGLGQLTGINAIMYYMSTLMGKIGFSEKKSVAMSMVGGAALLIGTVPAILWMDKFGRRPWSMTIVIFSIGLVLVGVGYLINPDTNIVAAEGVYLTGQILYNMAFGSYAALTWVLPSESFSLSTRSAGMTVASALLYIFTFTVTYNFDRMQAAMTYTGLTLGFYGGLAIVIGIPYQLLFMPETKNRTLEEIDDIFSRPTREIVAENVMWLKRGKLTY